jgi:response regulator of citrate/malate metabolism
MDAALNLDATGQRVTASVLANVFGVSECTGARYLSALTA